MLNVSESSVFLVPAQKITSIQSTECRFLSVHMVEYAYLESGDGVMYVCCTTEQALGLRWVETGMQLLRPLGITGYYILSHSGLNSQHSA